MDAKSTAKDEYNRNGRIIMATSKISDLFNNRFFEIPKYQRGYAWELQNVRDLFEDIKEAIESSSNHYMGTVVLSEGHPIGEHYFVVDGQQRLTTLMLLISEITRRLPKSDSEFFRRRYIKDPEYRLRPLGRDKIYFENLLEGKVLPPESKSQRYLKDAYEEIKSELNRQTDRKTDLQTLLRSIERLEIMEFIEKSEGDAIRIFQTVNDRGKLLTNMEKAKSLIVYYSNKYLNKALDSKVNDIFGEIFELYDDIKAIADDENIGLIRSIKFNEDNIMRYHFICFSDEDYDATAGFVLSFLKRRLSEMRASNDTKGMSAFITKYTDDLLQFFDTLKSLVEKTKTSSKHYKVLAILNLSATLYPFAVKLEQLNILDEDVPDFASPSGKPYTFLDLVELIDVRVYKTRGTDPRADISRFTYSLNDKSLIEIRDWLLWFNKNWMSHGHFESYMKDDVFSHAALPYIYIDYCEYLENTSFTREQLKKFVSEGPTIEHILAQIPTFSLTAAGFQNQTDFENNEHKLGNLSILETRFNSALRNKNPLEKTNTYDRSSYKMTRDLSSYIANTQKFDKKAIEIRTEQIWKYLSLRWPSSPKEPIDELKYYWNETYFEDLELTIFNSLLIKAGGTEKTIQTSYEIFELQNTKPEQFEKQLDEFYKKFLKSYQGTMP
jgi:uncharacterized protein with ParB-like and HNH nuclease domain